MVSLELLGGVSLEVGGRAVEGPPAQRHRLALLSLLAVHGSRTPTRDKLVAFLWPERDDVSARKLLNQSVYVLRKAFGEDVIRSAADELRLDTSLIYCDVTAFEAALARGELRRAAGLYSGPFLDGFFFGSSPSFEQWLDVERHRLAAAYASVLEQLAARAEAQRDVRSAVEWWRARAAHDPLDSRVALRLMEALEAAGNPAGALESASMHVRLLDEELGIAPPPEVGAAVERIRDRPGHMLVRGQEGHLPTAEPLISGQLSGATRDAPPLRPGDTRKWSRASPALKHGLAALLVATVAFGTWQWASGRSPHRTPDELVGLSAARPDESTGVDPTSALAARSTGSIPAYELYLQGGNPVVLRSDSAALRGLESLRKAVALDSTYSAAWAVLACLYLRVGTIDGPGAGRQERRALARWAAVRAVTLDDSSAAAHASLGLVHMTDFDFDAAERELKLAVALNPSYTRSREWLVALYLWTGRPREALVEADLATRTDPLSPSANAERARALAANDRCDEALTVLDELTDLRPQLLRARAIAAGCYAQGGHWRDAIGLLRTQVDRNPNAHSLAMLAHMLARAGRLQEALQIRDELRDRWEDDRSGALPLATVYAGLGDADRALTWLTRAIDDHSLVVSSHDYQVMTSIAQVLGGDSRFESLRRRLGLGRLALSRQSG